MPTVEVVWLRRDLRLTDHPALSVAVAAADAVVPLFVLDPRLLAGHRIGAPRLRFLAEALGDLAERLTARGGRLVVRRGDPVDVVPAVARETGATAVRWHDDVSPFAMQRDAGVAAALDADGRRAIVEDGVLVHPPGTILTSAGTPFRVFTPFARVWREREPGLVHRAPETVPVPTTLASEDPPAGAELGAAAGGPLPRGGETAARERRDEFLRTGAASYHRRRDLLGVDGTSRLSADLHFGCLSARELLNDVDGGQPGHDAFASQLAWRDFYAHVLAAWPWAADTELDPAWRELPWAGDGPEAEAWRQGRTGYPVVDAGMRQLRATGWMHNRARMIVASFLCKDLRVDWRLGEAHFLRHLVDGDVANNNGGWQWAAGTGTDAQPYFRIFNPVRQGRRFDPDGAYVRRWLPALARVPDRYVHAPWEMPEAVARESGVRVGEDYPAPIIDHADERRRTIAWFKAHRREP